MIRHAHLHPFHMWPCDLYEVLLSWLDASCIWIRRIIHDYVYLSWFGMNCIWSPRIVQNCVYLSWLGMSFIWSPHMVLLLLVAWCRYLIWALQSYDRVCMVKVDMRQESTPVCIGCVEVLQLYKKLIWCRCQIGVYDHTIVYVWFELKNPHPYLDDIRILQLYMTSWFKDCRHKFGYAYWRLPP